MPDKIPPQILDINGNLVAVLENAYGISYKKVKNGLWTCSFTLSMHDEKNAFINPKYFVELRDHEKRIGRFVVNAQMTIKDDSSGEITYHCDHVLALLHNDVLWGTHKWAGERTNIVLTDLLAIQETKHWRLGDVAFSREFHYSWVNGGSLLEAVASVPKRFQTPYLWTWDDASYPFTLNLIEPYSEITGTIIAGKNLEGVEIEEDPSELITRIYPLGDGEGAEQLNIEGVNGGLPYLEDAAAIGKYGIIKRIWEDKRYTDVNSLKDAAQGILGKYKQPLKSVKITAVDYELIDPSELERYEIGYNVLMYDEDTKLDEILQVEEIEKRDVYGSPEDITLVFGNLKNEITSDVNDIERELDEVKDETVYKGRVYNGTSITPEDGFMATRSNNTARAIMNATDGFKMQKGDGTGSGWVDVFYVDAAGNANFQGTVRASSIIGGTITGAQITSNSTIDVYTDLRVGNMIYVGSSGAQNKGIVFSDLVQLMYSNQAAELTGAVVTLSGVGSGGRVNLIAGNRVVIESGVETVLNGSVSAPEGVNGIRFAVFGDGVNVYRNGSFAGFLEFAGSVG